MTDEPNGYWWCPNCKEEIGAYHVTFQEQHEDCGHPVEWIELEKPMRKVKQLTMTALETHGCFWGAVCEDGSLWGLENIHEGWKRLPDIPQDDDTTKPQGGEVD